jgi:histidine triad (HIT) family protein
MTDCIFCRIVAGEAPAATVAETDRTVAFLDANPLARGHTLVIPKSHAERLSALDQATARTLMDELRRLAPAVERAVDADATTIGFNNGRAAGQEVPHVHGHVIPRSRGDGGGPLHAVLPGGGSDGNPEGTAAAIAAEL